jgi:UDP-N-acetyl-D-mannosaminuronic acid transferase (WecB/TagA/CpsF family)
MLNLLTRHTEETSGDSTRHRRILGVDFFSGTSKEAVAVGLRGGLVVVPSAPMLAEIVRDREYHDAARNADLVITDSGFMVLTWRLLTGERLPRTSGLKYLRLMLASAELRSTEKTLWIMPGLAAARRCIRWLGSVGFKATLEQFYIAPCYPLGPVTDDELLEFVRVRCPEHIIIGLGGGTQEKLGLYLKQNLSWKPGIHCVGAAIGFLTGDQVHIPDWADRLLLGWLFRCVSRPRRFVPRYWRSGKLAWLIWKYRTLSPVV